MQNFAHTENGIRRVWNVERLWQLAAALPVQDVPLDLISALDEVTWFSLEPEQLPTCRRVAKHARRIKQAEFTYAVILSAEGWVMDGMHRNCKAYLLGWKKGACCALCHQSCTR